MKLGIIGLLQSGRTTIFSALTGARGQNNDSSSSRSDSRLTTIRVLDNRVVFLSEFYCPKKTTYAQVEYLIPSSPHSSGSELNSSTWNQLRTCDALLHVVRNFTHLGGTAPSPDQDFQQIEDEMILSDLAVAEKRIERIQLDRKRGKTKEDEELPLLRKCQGFLEKGEALRRQKELSARPELKGFTFLSAKPQLVIINNGDDDEAMPVWRNAPDNVELLAVRGKLEMDIADMEADEAEEFKEAYNIHESVLDRVIETSYKMLNRLSFFTVGPDEVKAWPVETGTPARKAAGTIHSDIEKGFIRAEVLSFKNLKIHGSFQNAKKLGLVRLEGKDYEVKDGDIINFRFNV